MAVWLLWCGGVVCGVVVWFGDGGGCGFVV